MAASPTIANSTTEKWVTAITDLMALTQKHQLAWREEPAVKDPYLDSCLDSCYVTEFNGNTLILQKKPSENSPDSVWSRLLMSSANFGSPYFLRAFKPDGELLTTFPSVAALDGLKIAIDAQLQTQANTLEDSFLQAIHQATKSLA